MIADSNALVEAALWMEHLAVGQFALIAATIAVAWIGLMMLRGYVPTRRGGIALLGCFLLFGADAISQGLTKTDYDKQERSRLSIPAKLVTLNLVTGSSDYANPYESNTRDNVYSPE